MSRDKEICDPVYLSVLEVKQILKDTLQLTDKHFVFLKKQTFYCDICKAIKPITDETTAISEKDFKEDSTAPNLLKFYYTRMLACSLQEFMKAALESQVTITTSKYEEDD